MFALLLCWACDQKTPVGPDDSAPATSVTTAASAAPEPPKPPVVTVDETSFVVAGDKIEFGKSGDAKGRIVGLLSTKPLVKGETLEVDALRDVPMSSFAIAIEALHEAGAKAATVKTAKRDRTMGTLKVALEHPPAPACAAVASIAKDNAITVWPYGGAVAQRFTHGFAGPDITLGSAALVKQANACAAPVDFLGAEDPIKWGVVFDLALAAAETPGTRATRTVVLTKPPVPGRKVTE